MKKISISTAIIAVLSAVIVGSSGFAAYKYLTTDRSMLGSEGDKLASHYGGDNVNVMLTRSENWRQITEEKFLTRPDFSGIDGSTATIPITAELARQFCGASDDTTYRNNYVGSFVNHNKTDVAYENLILGRDNYVEEYDDHERKWNKLEEQVRLVFATPPSEDEYQTA